MSSPSPTGRRHPGWVLLIAGLLALFLAGAPDAAAPAAVRLHLRSVGSFDPRTQTSRVPSDLSVMGAQPTRAPARLGASQLWIVQFAGPVRPSWQELLLDAGAEILRYLPDYAYVVRVADRRLPRVRSLPHVRTVTPFRPAYALSPRLARPRRGRLDVRIETFLPEDVPNILTWVRKLGGRVKSVTATEVGSISADISWAGARALTRVYGVAWVEEELPLRPFNDVGSGICYVPATRTALGLYGTGQIVAVSDTGLDNGDAASVGIGAAGTLHPDFQGRLLSATSVNDRGTWDDPDGAGHGTHVAGSVLGNGLNSGSTPALHAYAGSYAGAAPEALLVFQSNLRNDGNLFSDQYRSNLYRLFQEAYDQGARIHSDSWGANVQGMYTSDSYLVDRFMWERQDMLCVFAAGNDGRDTGTPDGIVDLDSMGAPATAKNCLTVGATETERNIYSTTWSLFGNPSRFTTAPISTDRVDTSRFGMAAFSSRGPCDDPAGAFGERRIKPDLVAPGTGIASTRSQLLAGPLSENHWGRLSGAGLTTSGSLEDNSYHFNGGTSMATPLVAGMAALTRQYYQERENHPNPSAALLKATLLASAFDLHSLPARGQYTSAKPEQPSARPNAVQGWGRADLRKALNPAAHVQDFSGVAYPNTRLLFNDVRPGLRTGELDLISFRATTGTPLNIVLAYTDAPATTSASVTLVNNLDLRITGPGGTTWNGNGVDGDSRNNVESIDLPSSLTTGTYTIAVRGTNVPAGPQPYAVVVYGALPSFSQTLRTSPASTFCQYKRSVQLTALFNGQPTTGVEWKVLSGGGAVTTSGLYTAPPSGTSAVVEAKFGALTASTTITFEPTSPIQLPPIARIEIFHAVPSELVNMRVGTGANPDDPVWEHPQYRTGFGDTPGLLVEEFDLVGAPSGSLPPNTSNPWWVRIEDFGVPGENSGELRVFWVRYQGVQYSASTLPAPVPPTLEEYTTTIFINPSNSTAGPTILARVLLTHTQPSQINSITVGCGPNPASPLWESPAQTGLGAGEKLFRLDDAPAEAFPPSANYPWFVKINDNIANTATGQVSGFTITYNQQEYIAGDLPRIIPSVGTVIAWIDPRPPTVALTAPAPGASLTNIFTLTADATDNDTVKRVEFYVDDRLLATDATPPFGYAWDTMPETNGPHRISVRAFDPSGNTSESYVIASIANAALRPSVEMTVGEWSFNTSTRELTATATFRNAGPAHSDAWHLTLERLTLFGTGPGFAGERTLYMQPVSGTPVPRNLGTLPSGGTTSLQLKVTVPPDVSAIPRWTSRGYYFNHETGGNRYYL